MNEEDVATLARTVNELERIAARTDDPEARYRLEEAVRHVEVGVGEWATREGTAGDPNAPFDRE